MCVLMANKRDHQKKEILKFVACLSDFTNDHSRCRGRKRHEITLKDALQESEILRKIIRRDRRVSHRKNRGFLETSAEDSCLNRRLSEVKVRRPRSNRG